MEKEGKVFSLKNGARTSRQSNAKQDKTTNLDGLHSS